MAENSNFNRKGKPLNEYSQELNYFSSKASEINRTLAISGFAVIWLFKYTTEESKDVLPPELMLPAFFLLLSVSLDLLHYVYGYIAWKIFYHKKLRKWKKDNSLDEEMNNVEASKFISNSVTFLSLFKILPMIVGFFYLIKYLVFQLFL